MKKYLALLSAFVMLLSCSACGGDESKPAETSSAVESSTSAELSSTDLTTEESGDRGAEQTTVTNETPADESTSKNNESSSGGQAELGQLTQALYDRIQKMENGQVEMKMVQDSEEMPDMKVNVDVIVAQKKLRFIMKCGDLFTITMVGDGKDTYLLDEEHKLFCKMDQKDADNPMNAENTPLLNADGLGKYLGTGKADFKGVQRVYEEYLTTEEDDDTEKELDIRYYYDDKGDLIGFSSKKDGKEEMMDFSIRFSDEVKDSLFVLPEGYKEGSTEEVITSVYGKMFEALLGGLSDLGGLEDLDLTGGSISKSSDTSKSNKKSS